MGAAGPLHDYKLAQGGSAILALREDGSTALVCEFWKAPLEDQKAAMLRALNCHDDLVAALKGLTKIVNDMRADEGFDASTCDAGGILFGDIASEAIDTADAALAKAEAAP